VPPVDAWVLADPGRLRQVVANRLGNAVKFTPERGTVRALIEAGENDGWRVAVSDDGCGLTPEMLSRIFQPFVRNTEGNATGLGLGLAIALHIVQQHGGTLTGHSEGAGRGATFEVWLPRLAPSDPD